MADGEVMAQAKFRAMSECTPEDWRAVAIAHGPFNAELPDRLLADLRRLDQDGKSAFAVSRLEHSLQTATRAHRDGRDEEYGSSAPSSTISAIPSRRGPTTPRSGPRS